MKLKSLYIRRSYDGDKLNGEIEFLNQYGEIKLTLDEATNNKLLAVVADSLVDSARTIAADLTANVIDATRQIVYTKEPEALQ